MTLNGLEMAVKERVQNRMPEIFLAALIEAERRMATVAVPVYDGVLISSYEKALRLYVNYRLALHRHKKQDEVTPGFKARYWELEERVYKARKEKNRILQSLLFVGIPTAQIRKINCSITNQEIRCIQLRNGNPVSH